MHLTNSRRRFLSSASLGVVGAAIGAYEVAPAQSGAPPGASPGTAAGVTPGAPSAFATSAPVGPEVSATTFAEAGKLMQVKLSGRESRDAANSWRAAMAPLYERRTGPKKLMLETALAPASRWEPNQYGQRTEPGRDRFVRSKIDARPVPDGDPDIAFASVTQLSHWIETRQLSSERLTKIYLGRLERFDPKLRCVITPTRELALEQAKRADAEIAAGIYRGPLHGIPWGAKDLLDTAGIATTYGAEPFKNRIPTADATVVRRLHEAGAVLVAKLSLGALALNDIWFGGQTMNPWLLEEGSSGSSAGPGAATAAGLVGFSMGSETGGSIVSPSMRCGITGLRPTDGRVAR